MKTPFGKCFYQNKSAREGSAAVTTGAHPHSWYFSLFPRWLLLQRSLTDWELSLLLSLDLFFASLFFFLCRGLDSRIISSSSKVGSQCRRPFCGAQGHHSHGLAMGRAPSSSANVLRNSC